MKVEFAHNGFHQQALLNGMPSFLRICLSETFSPDFNVHVHTLDASSSSRLDWKSADQFVEKCRSYASYALWELEGGFSLETFRDEAFFLTFELAVEHFVNTVWSSYKEISLGVVLFKGPIEKYIELQHDLKLIASRFPEDVAIFVLLDTERLIHPSHFFSFARQDLLMHFYPVIKGKWAEKFSTSLPCLGWDHGNSPFGYFSSSIFPQKKGERQELAILYPQDEALEEIDRVISELQGKCFRMLPESLLDQEWEGIDDLIVFSSSLKERGRRKLMGFCAAGGRVVHVGASIGVDHEIGFEDYIREVFF